MCLALARGVRAMVVVSVKKRLQPDIVGRIREMCSIEMFSEMFLGLAWFSGLIGTSYASALIVHPSALASASAAAMSVFEIDMNSALVMLWYVELTSWTTKVRILSWHPLMLLSCKVWS